MQKLKKNNLTTATRVLIFIAGISMSVTSCAANGDLKPTLIKTDNQLNIEYKKLKASRSKEARKALLRDQKKWLVERDTECKLKSLPKNRDEWLAAVGKYKIKTQQIKIIKLKLRR